MNKVIKIFIFLILIATCKAMNATDIVNEAEYERVKLQQAEEIYRLVTDKEPTVSNIHKSLDIGEAQGKEMTELMMALDIAVLGHYRNQIQSDVFNRVYKNNPKNWPIKVKSAAILLGFDKFEGERLLKAILEQKDEVLEAKLSASFELVSNNNLEGYLVLEQGLVSENIVEKRLAIDLLDKFTEHEGKYIAEIGSQVDINGLILTARSSIGDPYLLSRLDEFEKRFNKIRFNESIAPNNHMDKLKKQELGSITNGEDIGNTVYSKPKNILIDDKNNITESSSWMMAVVFVVIILISLFVYMVLRKSV